MNKISGLVFLSMGIVAGGCGAPPAGDEAGEPVVAVRVARVLEVDLAVEAGGPATVYPREQASLASRLTTRILGLEARKGDVVSVGQVLARLEDSDLVAARREAAGTVADAEATLARVTSGTVPVEFERARGQVAAAQAALDQARANYDRRQDLFEQGAIPERDLLASRTELATATAGADLAASELRLMEEQTGALDVQIARSRLEQARGHLELVDSQLDFATIRAPFSGTIVDQFLFPGDMAGPDRPVFTLADLSVAVARAQVPETDAAEVGVGQRCELSLVDRPGTAYPGRVSVVGASVDARTRAVEVWCEIANRDANLRAGAFGNLAITTSTVSGAEVVPVDAVQFEHGTSRGVVMVADPEGISERREVVTGSVAEDRVEILSGLAPGEIVIVEGGYGLPEGTRVIWAEDPE